MAGRITVVGLGPAGAELITAETAAALAAHRRRYVRTFRHPSASAVSDAVGFDDAYQQSSSFEEVYETICDRLAAAAAAHGDLLYAVPGSPLVLERSVELLRARHGDGLRVLPALSFLDLAWSRLSVDPLEAGVRLVDGQRFAVSAAGCSGPLLAAQCHDRRILSEIKLAVPGEPEVAVVLQRLGLPDESIREVPWRDLDRAVEPDHLTSLYVPELAEPVAAEIVRFDELVRTLREQCPWDREQTHASLRRHLLEETYETLEAIDERAGLDDDDVDERLDDHLREELGDLLYQVWFQARMASERGAFTMADVARGVHDKLVERHPHVFGDVVARDVQQVRANWETRKQREKGRASVMDGMPATLPALLRAVKVLKRADAAGLIGGFGAGGGSGAGGIPGDLGAAPFEALRRATAVLRAAPDERRLGEVLLAAVDLARNLRLDPEDALRMAVGRAEEAFRAAEKLRGASTVRA